MKYVYLIKLLLVFFTCIAFAQDNKPLIEVNSQVDTSIITIGDRITYTISIDHVDGMRVEQPGAGVHLGQFEIKDYQIHDPVKKEDRIILKYEYVISVFDTGSFIIPAFPIAYFPEDSLSDYKIIEASPITIYVESVIDDETRELKDIRGPIDIPYNYIFLISMIIVALLITAIIYFGFIFYKRRKERGYLIRPPEPPRPAHELALEALDELLLKNLIEQGDVKLFYSEISEIVRRYIENRFFISALEETSREILQEMKNENLPDEQFDGLKSFLELSDFVKFAKYIPMNEENEHTVHWVREFIVDTQIKYEQEAESELIAEAS